MTQNQKLFYHFLCRNSPYPDEVFGRFSQYFNELLRVNDLINLISRKTDPDDIWIRHFYDSLLPIGLPLSLNNKRLLDVGTGGGLPGVPFKLINNTLSTYLLDSKEKKVKMLKCIVRNLGLKDCYALRLRIEDMYLETTDYESDLTKPYDIIVCRSVRTTSNLIDKMLSLLHNGGSILLYKGKSIDFDLPGTAQVFDFGCLPWGERKIVKIDKV